MGPGLGIDYSQRGVSIRHFALDAGCDAGRVLSGLHILTYWDR